MHPPTFPHGRDTLFPALRLGPAILGGSLPPWPSRLFIITSTITITTARVLPNFPPFFPRLLEPFGGFEFGREPVDGPPEPGAEEREDDEVDAGGEDEEEEEDELEGGEGDVGGDEEGRGGAGGEDGCEEVGYESRHGAGQYVGASRLGGWGEDCSGSLDGESGCFLGRSFFEFGI